MALKGWDVRLWALCGHRILGWKLTWLDFDFLWKLQWCCNVPNVTTADGVQIYRNYASEWNKLQKNCIRESFNRSWLIGVGSDSGAQGAQCLQLHRDTARLRASAAPRMREVRGVNLTFMRWWSLYVRHSGQYMYRHWSLYVPHSRHYLYRTVVNICTAIGHYMYRTVVTICTAQWSLYVPHSGHYI